jgi:hypothetical protein
MVRAAEGIYADELIFESNQHWRNELEPLRQGLQELRTERSSFSPPSPQPVYRFDFGEGPAAEGWLAVGYETEYDLRRGGWGWLPGNRHFLPRPALDPARRGASPEDDFIRGPRQYNFSSFVCDLPPGTYRLSFRMHDSSVEPQDYGPMWFVANGVDETPHFSVPAGDLKEVVLETYLPDGNLSLIVKAESHGTWLLNSLEVTPVGPTISHFPVTRTAPGGTTEIWATVFAQAPVGSVTLLAGDKLRGFASTAMERVAEHLYRGRLPEAGQGERIHYAIDARDSAGRPVRWPATDRSQTVLVTNDVLPPEVTHTPVEKAPANRPLRITARATDLSGVAFLNARYRSVNQHQDFYSLPMLPTGRPDEFAATIPAEHVRAEWDLMYFIEAMDQVGNGWMVPGLEGEMPYFVVRLER